MMMMMVMRMKSEYSGRDDDYEDHDDCNYCLQLRREKKVDREKMSVTCKDLADYVKEQSAVGL